MDQYWSGDVMRISTVLRALGFASATIVLSACQGPQGMDGQTIAYNNAVADSTNQFFLLNALRARDRFPIYYSRTTGNNAAASLSPSVTLGVTDWNWAPTATVGASASNTLSLTNLDDQRFMRGVLTPVPLSTLDFYFGQAWPREILLMMFVKQITIDPDLVSKLADQFDAYCGVKNDQERNADREYCSNMRPSGAPSPSVTIRNVNCPGVPATGDTDSVFDNYPSPDRHPVAGAGPGAQSPTRMVCFQAMLRVLVALGLAPNEGTKFKVIMPNVPASRVADLKGMSAAVTAKLAIAQRESSGTYAVCTTSNTAGFTLDKHVIDSLTPQPKGAKSYALIAATKGADPSIGQVTTSLIASAPQSCADKVKADEEAKKTAASETKLAPIRKNCAEHPELKESKACKSLPSLPPTFSFTTRSLDSMVYYLGEDLRAGDHVSVWESGADRKQHETQLFSVKPGERGASALVSAEYRGQTYIIPDECDGRADCDQQHRSLQVLSLLNQLWGLQKEATDAPTVPVVSVINGH